MDGQFHTGQLSRAVFSMAAESDDAELRALVREVPMRGEWQMGIAREPSFFACPQPAGIEERVLLARLEGRLVSVGSWSLRDVWLGGDRARVGYLHGLRMAEGTSGSIRVLRDGYRRLALESGAESLAAWFTSVDAGNQRARRLFESRLSGLPRYEPIARYQTRVLPVSRRGEIDPAGGHVDLEELSAFLNEQGQRYHLALRWDAERWRHLAQQGLLPEDLVQVRRRGRLVAVAGLWDQSPWRQWILHRCPSWVESMRPVAKLLATVLAWPGLPPAGAAVPLAMVFPFAVAEPAVLADLWRGLERRARSRGLAWLAHGMDEADPLWNSAGMPRVGLSYRTILYSVVGEGFADSPIRVNDRLLRPECATL